MSFDRDHDVSALPSMPLRMGYFLMRAAGLQTPYGTYRGINRLPIYPHFDALERVPLPAGSIFVFEQPWEAYFDAEASTELQTNLALALQLQREFASQGIAFDLVYVEVSFMAEQLGNFLKAAIWAASLERFVQRWKPIHEQLAGPGPGHTFLGYDVSLPEPTFHSYLLHSLEEDERGALPLNSNGLLSNMDDAMLVLHKANELGYSDSPHCVQGIWAVPQDELRLGGSK